MNAVVSSLSKLCWFPIVEIGHYPFGRTLRIYRSLLWISNKSIFWSIRQRDELVTNSLLFCKIRIIVESWWRLSKAVLNPKSFEEKNWQCHMTTRSSYRKGSITTIFQFKKKMENDFFQNFHNGIMNVQVYMKKL